MPITFDVDSTKTPEHKPSFTTFDEAFLPVCKLINNQKINHIKFLLPTIMINLNLQ